MNAIESPQMPSAPVRGPVRPRIIIHGGAGEILQSRIPPARRRLYRASLLRTVQQAASLLASGASALEAATAAVAWFEDDPLFNSGRGAVFTRAGTIEHEASVMVSRGSKKRAAAVSLLSHVKNPVMLARKMLEHGEEDMEGKDVEGGAQPGAANGEGSHDDGLCEDGNPDGGVGWSKASAGGHCHLSGAEAERLAAAWGLELVDARYFWTRKRWEEHRKGLEKGRPADAAEVPTWAQITADEDGELRVLLATEDDTVTWDGIEYLPQGTVGAVALDASGVLCAATSTGGLTNKLSGRIGDTPTIGAGFWAEECAVSRPAARNTRPSRSLINESWLRSGALPDMLGTVKRNCFPWLQDYLSLPQPQQLPVHAEKSSLDAARQVHALAISGTGNGDSFLRMGLARWTAAIPRLTTASLATAVTRVLGRGGELQRSAGDRWGKTGEGEGGAIGIELVNGQGTIAADYNCPGMFRAWVDDNGNARARIWREDLEDDKLVTLS